MKITYEDSGVSLKSAVNIVDSIKKYAKNTYTPGLISGIGGFFSAVEVKGYDEPVIISSCDGVGTKLKLAMLLNKHDTVGIDLVAMSVNDVITSGAKVISFLDYIAIGKCDENIVSEIIKGVSEGCKLAGCPLIGGETAEMPGFYADNEYDLAGFAVGVVEKRNLPDLNLVRSGDVVIGVSSSGVHSNGFSLCRKLFIADTMNNSNLFPESPEYKLLNELLTPTRIYSQMVQGVLNFSDGVRSIAHITGGGLIENLPRSFTDSCTALIDLSAWDIPPIFKLIQNKSGLSILEMLNVFNMGIGMTLIVSENTADQILNYINDNYFEAYIIGKITDNSSNEKILFAGPDNDC